MDTSYKESGTEALAYGLVEKTGFEERTCLLFMGDATFSVRACLYISLSVFVLKKNKFPSPTLNCLFSPLPFFLLEPYFGVWMLAFAGYDINDEGCTGMDGRGGVG